MIVRIKIVPDAEPDADGTWKMVETTLPFPRSWVVVEDCLAPYVPEGYHIVAYEIASA